MSDKADNSMALLRELEGQRATVNAEIAAAETALVDLRGQLEALRRLEACPATWSEPRPALPERTAARGEDSPGGRFQGLKHGTPSRRTDTADDKTKA